MLERLPEAGEYNDIFLINSFEPHGKVERETVVGGVVAGSPLLQPDVVSDTLLAPQPEPVTFGA